MVFSSDYKEARARLLHAADRHGLEVSRYQHPNLGPDGETLTTDVVAVGPREASTVIVINSGTHGVEGFLGSALQQSIISENLWSYTPHDVRWVLIHALNPWGYAWLRRTNESNVDLNRNFVDFDQPLPVNPQYEELTAALVPDDLEPATLLKADQTLWEIGQRVGQSRLQEAITRGQYSHPDGLHFGGQHPSWSAQTFYTIVERELSNALHLFMIDVHTGLGSYGAAEIIAEFPRDSACFTRAKQAWGENVRSTVDGESLSPKLTGAIDHALVERLPSAMVTPVALEVGTRSPIQVFQALRADNWLHTRGDPRSEYAKRIKEQIRNAFFPEETNWQERAMSFGAACLKALVEKLS